MQPAPDPGIESQIRQWRSFLLRRQTLDHVDVDELEDHLRSEMSELRHAGLANDESFLVAIKRLGSVSSLSREFARERSSRLWKQLVLEDDEASARPRFAYFNLAVTLAIALAAALAFKVPALFGIDPFSNSGSDNGPRTSDESFYLRYAALMALPFLVTFFAWQRQLSAKCVSGIAAVFGAAAVVVSAFSFKAGGDTELLVGIHLPVLLWLTAGVAYLGGAWRADAPRMDFVRFTGEWIIYYTLVALGGGVLAALTLGVFGAIDIDMAPFVQSLVLPCGAVGAVVVVAWLVEAKQSVVENMAPVLTGIFTPLFALMLVAAMTGMAVTGNLIDADRDVLIVLDLLLILVVGLLLYAFSARDSEARPGLLDAVQLVLVLSALTIDAFALVAIFSRITELGYTPNRVAGLGLNAVLLVNLAWSAWLLAAFLGRKRPFSDLARWQTRYIPVYAGWAALVVAVFPLAFGFE